MFEILTEADLARGAEDGACSGTGEKHFADKRAAPEAPAGSIFGRESAAAELDPQIDASPLEALKRIVRGCVELTRRFPTRGRFLFCGQELGRADDELRSEVVSAFATISSNVRAAQLAGELKSGDADHIAVLILGAMIGAADLAQNGRVRAASAIRDLEALPLLLLDRLATKRYH